MKMKSVALGFAVFGLGVAGAMAQAPAGAPAGTNGICKDGTYSTAAAKSGACRGHNGVQTWYSAAAPKASAPVKPATPAPASTPKAAPAPTATTKPVPAAPAPTPAPAPKAAPVPTPAAAAPAAPAPGKKLSPTQAAATKTAAPGGGPGLVWVNTASNVYHCNGDAFYGKTKAGAYMSEADAKSKGAHGEHGQTCAGK